MKIYQLLIYFVLVFNISLFCQPQYRAWNAPNAQQPLHIFGPPNDYPNTLISEDFGPRQLNADRYQWHGGIDYNSNTGNTDLGDLLLSLEAGVVSPNSLMANNSTKVLVVEGSGTNGHNLRYVHVFTCTNPSVASSQVGGSILQMMDPPNDHLWAVVIMDSTNNVAIGPTQSAVPGSNPEVTFFDPNNVSRTISVK